MKQKAEEISAAEEGGIIAEREEEISAGEAGEEERVEEQDEEGLKPSLLVGGGLGEAGGE
jgi:hypothetical protein